MLRAAFLGCALILPALFAPALPGRFVAGNVQISLGHDCRHICHGVSRSISPTTQVFSPDIAHWVNSSSQISACSARPGTAEDLGSIVRELGLTRTPFAIKGSGHNANPGFSSTPGVHISMARFRDIVLNEEEGTVEIGAGLTWTDVYSYLVPEGLNVVGGRMDGVGVSGFTLGGGYSWKTNQYGLTIDTVTAFELVLPNGHVRKVTEEDEDLWFALRGIVTKYTLKTHKQTDVWGAVLDFKGDQIEPAYTAFARWLFVDHDHKGAQMGAITYSKGTVGFQLVLFYDGPEPPSCLYVVKATIDDVKTLGDKLGEKDEDALIVFNLGAIESDIFTHGGPSVYPPDPSRTILPSSVFVEWNDESLDKDGLSASISKAGIYDGQDLKHAAHYTNLALYGTPLEMMYGKKVKRLREINKKYDPFRVMDLTGGFRL
ncbi:FAD-binding domain-containing protein [Lactarius akahatsu]|uniref:FAD-binding domain-containing protein n=1 Tax=Lactarius akahatsu TaxID=416441 RepID=A0AAD4Q8H3_9AGAM|nr:FAD-binding domain-containing protein [Lactarius akahatsu]